MMGYPKIYSTKDKNIIKNNKGFQLSNYKFEIDEKKIFLDAYKRILIKNELDIKNIKQCISKVINGLK